MKTFMFSLLCILGSHVAFAQPSVMFDDLTATEIKEAVEAGKTTLVVYVGGYHENVYSETVNAINGPTRDHTAVSKHNIIANYLARRVAEELGNALALSAISYTPNGNAVGQQGKEFTGELGPNPGHARFAGTISVTNETYARLMDDIVSSAIVTSRFKNVVIMSDNGGAEGGFPGTLLKEVTEAIASKWAPKGVNVAYFPVYFRAKVECGKTIAKLDLPKELRTKSDSYNPGSLEGCIIPIDDAAEVLALDKEGKWVRVHKLPVPPYGARLVTRELGQTLLDQKVRIAIDMIRNHMSEGSR
jgi:hypothetical protein